MTNYLALAEMGRRSPAPLQQRNLTQVHSQDDCATSADFRRRLGVGFEEFAQEGRGVFAEHAPGREIASVYAHKSSVYNHL